jgi:hypothetical protein
MTLNYRMIVERYPNRTEWVPIPAREIITVVDGEKRQVVKRLLCKWRKVDWDEGWIKLCKFNQMKFQTYFFCKE